MGDALHIDEAERRLNPTSNDPRMLEREGRNPSKRWDSKDHIYSALNLALLRAGGVGHRPSRLMGCLDLAEATT